MITTKHVYTSPEVQISFNCQQVKIKVGKSRITTQILHRNLFIKKIDDLLKKLNISSNSFVRKLFSASPLSHKKAINYSELNINEVFDKITIVANILQKIGDTKFINYINNNKAVVEKSALEINAFVKRKLLKNIHLQVNTKSQIALTSKPDTSQAITSIAPVQSLSPSQFIIKTRLNYEFKQKAKIQGLVSYIYYPSQREFVVMGHAELEVEGTSWTVMCDTNNHKPLYKMIKSSKRGCPFIRFPITVTPNQLQDLRENRTKIRGITCAWGVGKALSTYAGYTIPFPLVPSPLMSAIYLTSARILGPILGSRRIKKIEIYRGNIIKNISTNAIGIFGESCGIICTVFFCRSYFT